MTKFLKNWWLDYTFKHCTSCMMRNPVIVDNLTAICFGKYHAGQPDQNSLNDEFLEWKETIHGKCHFTLWSNTAYFSREEDAMCFKLRFA